MRKPEICPISREKTTKEHCLACLFWKDGCTQLVNPSIIHIKEQAQILKEKR